tara:strand:- start:243 stop:992 length:750 start_codon:yes stop_codon:yes gene_type:complete
VADPIKQFKITPLTQEPLVVGGVDISFTNSALWMAIAVVISVGFFLMAMQRKSIVPNRMQMMAEMVYGFVADMVRENVGVQGRKYFPFIFTIFILVLMGNLLGMIPGSFTFTSHIAVTGALALMIFFACTVIGFARHGLHFFSFFCPAGLPWALKPIIIPIEILSFMIRPVTLSVRLFANMMAGHLILKVFAGFSVMMLGMGTVGYAMGVLPVLLNSLLIAFEILIALLQAYVFAILACIYLKDSIDLH